MSDVRNIPFGRPWITDDDRKAVLEVLEGHILTHGPQCRQFEEEFAAFLGEGAHCVSVSSCSAALHLAYFHLGLGPGDEVIVPAQTHTATAHAVELVGARPVFAECDARTGNIDCSKLEALITPRTKALSLVHFLGIPCAMDDVMTIAQRHRLKVVEDCALAIGTRYNGRHAGLFGDAGCFSFYPVKHMTTGEGGMFVSRHPDVAATVGKLRAFGVDRGHAERVKPGMYDVLMLGLNYRMSEMQAALGRRQLMRITDILDRRRANFGRLKSSLAGVQDVAILDTRSPAAASSHYCLTVVLRGEMAARRDDVVASLNRAGVGTSIYYPHPVPRLTYYRNKYGYAADAYAEAARISDCSIALPVGPHLTPDDMDYIAAQLTRALKELNVQ